MPVKNQAAYMREYRARKKFTVTEVNPGELEELRSEIERLTEEVARLKRELAKRGTDTSVWEAAATTLGQRDPYSEFRPAPKTGRK